MSTVVTRNERESLDPIIQIRQCLITKSKLTGGVDYEAGVSTWRSNKVPYSRMHHRRYRIILCARLPLAQVHQCLLRDQVVVCSSHCVTVACVPVVSPHECLRHSWTNAIFLKFGTRLEGNSSTHDVSNCEILPEHSAMCCV